MWEWGSGMGSGGGYLELESKQIVIIASVAFLCFV